MEEKIYRIIENLKVFTSKLSDPLDGLDHISERLRGVFERRGVRYALLFGSRARKGVGRDFDIAVSIDAKSALELGELLSDIAEALGVREDYIDLVHIESAGLSILHTILNEGILIYGNSEDAKEHLYKRYLELLDLTSISY